MCVFFDSFCVLHLCMHSWVWVRVCVCVCVCVYVCVCVCVIDETEHSTYFSSPLIGWCSCTHQSPSLSPSLSLSLPPSLPPSLSLPLYILHRSIFLSLSLSPFVSLVLIGCCIPSFHLSMASSQWGDRIGFLLDKRLPLGCRKDREVGGRLLPAHRRDGLRIRRL